MTSPIDPNRRADPLRRNRGAKPSTAGSALNSDFDERNLPVVLESEVEPPPPPPQGRAASAAHFAAHIMGQDGQKRGLRGGAPVLDAARQSYTRTEWSGSADRRAKPGRGAKTEI
jgi:hypothetical protein